MTPNATAEILNDLFILNEIFKLNYFDNDLIFPWLFLFFSLPLSSTFHVVIFVQSIALPEILNNYIMRRIVSLLTLVASCVFCQAQTAEDSVKIAVNRLFEGMMKADAEMLKAAFADSAILQTIATNKEGKVIIRNESVAEFAQGISKLPAGAADERITFDVIRIDGPLAIVWAPYKFYYNGKFTHCGVDSFQLVRVNGQWKIQYLVDTRRKEACD